MKKVLRFISAKAFILLSIQTYAQSSVRSYDLVTQKEQSLDKHAAASAPAKRKRSAIPDIRRAVSEESISLYPNPVVDKLLVEVDLDQWQGGVIMIKSRSGRKIAQQYIAEVSTGFNLASVNRGVYFLTVRKGGSERTVELIKL